jgi:hypothetical protein
MSKMLYYTYILIAIVSLLSTVLCAIWWRNESIYNSDSYTPIEPVLFTLISFAVMIYFINKLFLFID